MFLFLATNDNQGDLLNSLLDAAYAPSPRIEVDTLDMKDQDLRNFTFKMQTYHQSVLMALFPMTGMEELDLQKLEKFCFFCRQWSAVGVVLTEQPFNSLPEDVLSRLEATGRYFLLAGAKTEDHSTVGAYIVNNVFGNGIWGAQEFTNGSFRPITQKYNPHARIDWAERSI